MKIVGSMLWLDQDDEGSTEFAGFYHLTKVVAAVMDIDYDSALTLQQAGKVLLEGQKMKQPVGVYLPDGKLKINDQEWTVRVKR
jgi:hypothetical protein